MKPVHQTSTTATVSPMVIVEGKSTMEVQEIRSLSLTEDSAVREALSISICKAMGPRTRPQKVANVSVFLRNTRFTPGLAFTRRHFITVIKNNN
jgi:hypothetical protein